MTAFRGHLGSISQKEFYGHRDLLTQEMLTYGIQRMKDGKDFPRLEWENCPYMISDNLPLIEGACRGRRHRERRGRLLR